MAGDKVPLAIKHQFNASFAGEVRYSPVVKPSPQHQSNDSTITNHHTGACHDRARRNVGEILK